MSAHRCLSCSICLNGAWHPALLCSQCFERENRRLVAQGLPWDVIARIWEKRASST